MAVHVQILIIFIGLILLILFIRKVKGLNGTWDSKKEIAEYAILMGETTTATNLENPTKIKVYNQQKKNYFKPQISNKQESIGERICRDYLEKKFNTKFKNERPDFLRNPITNNNLELDCYSKKLRLALEYNGKQHYEYVEKFHKTKTDFYNQKYRDDIKKRLCYENGIDLIEVPYNIPHHQIPEYINEALKLLDRI